MSYLPTTEPGSGPFYTWLVQGQIEPAFAAHGFLRRAVVMGIPDFWRVDASGTPHAPIRLMIFYSQDERVQLDAVVSAHTHDTQDPNLPAGMCNHDLFQPVDPSVPVAFCPPSFFVGGEIDVENDDGGVLAHFFVYASFRRTADAIACDRRDDQMGERMDRFMLSLNA